MSGHYIPLLDTEFVILFSGVCWCDRIQLWRVACSWVFER